jgi:hypothetical protein
VVPDFAKLLELAGPKVAWLFLACVLMRWLNARGLISLHDISPSAAAINDVVAILSGAFTLGWIVEAVGRWRERRAEAKQHRKEARQFLRNLSPREEEILRSLLTSNQRSYAARMDGYLRVLVHKRLLDAVPGPGDNHGGSLASAPVYVFAIPTVVWEEMCSLWPDDCIPAKK